MVARREIKDSFGSHDQKITSNLWEYSWRWGNWERWEVIRKKKKIKPKDQSFQKVGNKKKSGCWIIHPPACLRNIIRDSYIGGLPLLQATRGHWWHTEAPVEYVLKLSLAYRETSTLQEGKRETTRKGANMREEWHSKDSLAPSNVCAIQSANKIK